MTDDTFVILSKYAARWFLVHINNINEAIQFTVDSENEQGALPFLDCLIKRNPDGTLDTTVYKKPTNIGRYLRLEACNLKGKNHSSSVEFNVSLIKT